MWGLAKEAFEQWQQDNASRLAAALAFYTIFSLAPTFVIILAVAASVVGEAAARAEVVEHLNELFGHEGARLVLNVAESARRDFSGVWAIVVGVGALLFGATIVFAELHDALNTVWHVESRSGVRGFVYRRFLGFLMVLGIGFLLLVSVAASAALSAASHLFGDTLPIPTLFWQTVNFAASFGLVTVLFALVYKFVPDATIAWSDVWIGSLITALFFTIGKSLIGLYLGSSSLKSVYGAAGSFVVLLLWIYYSAQIFLFGAEFTQAYAGKYGSRIRGRRSPPKPA